MSTLLQPDNAPKIVQIIVPSQCTSNTRLRFWHSEHNNSKTGQQRREWRNDKSECTITHRNTANYITRSLPLDFLSPRPATSIQRANIALAYSTVHQTSQWQHAKRQERARDDVTNHPTIKENPKKDAHHLSTSWRLSWASLDPRTPPTRAQDQSRSILLR